MASGTTLRTSTRPAAAAAALTGGTDPAGTLAVVATARTAEVTTGGDGIDDPPGLVHTPDGTAVIPQATRAAAAPTLRNGPRWSASAILLTAPRLRRVSPFSRLSPTVFGDQRPINVRRSARAPASLISRLVSWGIVD
ncbi:hypothetical protein OSJ78_11725, partial [Mycobacterium ulcerans]